MRRGFLTQQKHELKPKAGSSKGSEAQLSAIISQYPSSNNVILGEDDAKRWARSLGESQVDFDNRLERQLARVEDQDFKMIFRNMQFTEFQGVMFADNKIIDLLPRQFGPRPSALENAYKIASAAGKGSGMFAARDIPAGAIIVAENPVFVFPNIITIGLSLSKDEIFKMLFDRLQPDVRERALSLANSKPADVCGKEEGIVRTNGFSLSLPTPKGSITGTRHSGIFLDISRCNHSCGPNTSRSWSLSSYSMSLFATRPIAKGEEITTEYVTLTDSRATRRGKLFDMYLFHCDCDFCNLPSSKAIAASDAARLELEQWPEKSNHKFQEWSANLSLPANHLVDIHKHCIELHERESILDTDYASNMGSIAMIYGLFGDEKNFKLWGGKAAEMYEILKAEDSAKVWKHLLIDPQEKVEFWGLRSKSRRRQ